ncbi:MAG: hypothetical protein H6918_02895 [Sphingomonadaceae bacterium]|nr:hypothetical protein [Sphingomonadaceae bacterium]
MRGIALLALLPLTLGGCVARTAVDAATAPVKVAGKAVDLATTSQSERDEERGRELRKLEERAGRLERQYERERRNCLDGDRRACSDAQGTYAELQLVLRQLPAPPTDD